MSDPDQDPPHPPADELRWDRVLAWRSRLASEDAGAWTAPAPLDGADFHMPYAEPSDTVLSWVAVLYEEQVIAAFDWGTWMRARGRQLLDDPERLARDVLLRAGQAVVSGP